jgi:hypothetical protein
LKGVDWLDYHTLGILDQIIMSPKCTCGYLFLLVFCLLTLRSRLAEGVPSTHGRGEQLSRAFASPMNVDPRLDCALKELAWEYAKKLLPRVSPTGR